MLTFIANPCDVTQRERCTPIATSLSFPTQTPGTLYLSQIDAAVESAATIAHYDLLAPTADVAFAAGHLPAVPTITFN